MKDLLSPARTTMESFALCPLLIVVRDDAKESGANICVASYVGVLSETPPIIGVALRPQRHTHGLIERFRAFSINLPEPSMLKALDFCGSKKGIQVDKAGETGLVLTPAVGIDGFNLDQCPINLECQLIQTLTFPELGASHTYFVGRVVRAWRRPGYELDRNDVIVTTNYTYRLAAEKMGEAYKSWRKE